MQKQYKIKNIKMDKKYLETIKNPKRNKKGIITKK